MEDIGASLGWLYEATGLKQVGDAIGEWASQIDWSPLFALLMAAVAIYAIYVLLDESV